MSKWTSCCIGVFDVMASKIFQISSVVDPSGISTGWTCVCEEATWIAS